MTEKKDRSRRSFMKNGAITAAGITAFNVLSSKDARAQAPIKVGLIGCGGRGRGAAMNSLQSSDNVKITALSDIFPEKIELAKKELAKMDNTVDDDQCFLGFKSYKDLVKTDVDYVILATPPCYRPETLEAAVAAKKHVFMEKPAAVDPPGIRRIIAAGKKAKRLGLSIAAGTQRRHQEEYIETIGRIHDGAIGEIVNAQAFWCGGPIGFGDQKPGMTDIEWQIRSWYHFLWLSGDHILEQHVHNIDVINWIMGAHPVKAFAVGGCAWQERGNIWDHHAVEFEYPNGMRMFSLCSQYQRPNSRVQEAVQGTKGQSNCSNWIKSGSSEWKSKKKGAPYVQEHTDLIASIRSGSLINESRNVAESTMTAMMGRMAGYTGKEYNWDMAYNSDEKYPIYYELKNIDLPNTAVPGGKKYTGDEGWKPG